MTDKTVVILRGIPGSGKSTYAASEFPNAALCSADDYFVGEDGVYDFRPSEIGEAHATCMRKFISATQEGAPLVVVDNTNTSIAEVAPYHAVGTAYGYSVVIITIECDPEMGASRTVHGVPPQAVLAMHERLVAATAQFMPWWQHQVVTAQ